MTALVNTFSFESLFGQKLNTKDGEANTSNLLDGKSVMVYFR
jgi:hypothetical protein